MRNKSREAFRNEWKYLISTSEKEMLMLRLKPFLQPDPHAGEGGYYIRSLYFDDYWNSAYAEKEAGVLMRKKYRIRIYNNNDKFIKLERKKKFGSYIYKESAPLTREEVEKILKGDYAFLLYSPHSLCREFYIECTCNMMRPRTIVDYERIPWILDVKFTEMLPQLLRDVLPPPAAEFTAVSKYVLCYEKTRYMNGFEYWYET